MYIYSFYKDVYAISSNKIIFKSIFCMNKIIIVFPKKRIKMKTIETQLKKETLLQNQMLYFMIPKILNIIYNLQKLKSGQKSIWSSLDCTNNAI